MKKHVVSFVSIILILFLCFLLMYEVGDSKGDTASVASENNLNLSGDYEIRPIGYHVLSAGVQNHEGNYLQLVVKTEKGLLKGDVVLYLDSYRLGRMDSGEQQVFDIVTSQLNHVLSIYDVSSYKNSPIVQEISVPSDRTVELEISNNRKQLEVLSFSTYDGVDSSFPSSDCIDIDDTYAFDIHFGGRTINTKRGHIDDDYYVDLKHKVMLCHTTGSTKDGKINRVSAYRLEVEVLAGGYTKILRWYSSSGELADSYYRISGDKAYIINKNGEISETYKAKKAGMSVIDTLTDAENFESVSRPSLVWDN